MSFHFVRISSYLSTKARLPDHLLVKHVKTLWQESNNTPFPVTVYAHDDGYANVQKQLSTIFPDESHHGMIKVVKTASDVMNLAAYQKDYGHYNIPFTKDNVTMHFTTQFRYFRNAAEMILLGARPSISGILFILVSSKV